MQSLISAISIREVIGLCGAALYSLGYLLAAYDRLPSQSPAYYILKLVAAVLVMISLTSSFNLASLVIQVFFIVVSVIGICRHLDLRRRQRAFARSCQAVGGRAGPITGSSLREEAAVPSAADLPFLPLAAQKGVPFGAPGGRAAIRG